MAEAEAHGVRVNYDRESDVLYLTFLPERVAVGFEASDGVILRLDPETNELIGLTVIGFSERSPDDIIARVRGSLFVPREELIEA
jgi:uncharacterized protein YuzE